MTEVRQECFILKQIPAKVEDLKKGTMFRIKTTTKNETTDKDGQKVIEQSSEYSDLNVALEDFKVVEGNPTVVSDVMHIVMGAPQVANLTFKKTDEGYELLKAQVENEKATEDREG